MYKDLRNIVLGIMGRNQPQEQPTKPTITQKKGKLSSMEKILYGEELQEEVSEIVSETQDEMMRTAYFLTRAERKGLTDEDIFRNIENKIKENYKMTRKIYFEFIPKTQANRNMRSFLDYTGNTNLWKHIRDTKERDSNFVCEICGNSSREYGNGQYNYDTHCHEVWEYKRDDNKTPIQKLVKLESLCIYCHSIKHLNQHHNTKRFFDLLIGAYANINEITKEKAKEEYDLELGIFMREKNERKYKLDLSYLYNLDIPDLTDLMNTYKGVFDCHLPTFNSYIETANLYRNLDRDESGKLNIDDDEEQREK